MLKQRPPGCCRADRHSGGLNKAQDLRFACESLDRYCDILSVASLCNRSIDGLPNLEGRYVGTNLFDYSRHLDARRIGKRHWLEILHQALTDFPVDRVDARRVDPQQHFARPWLRTWLIFKFELFGSTITMDLYRSHGVC